MYINHPIDPAFYLDVKESEKPTREDTPAPYLLVTLGDASDNTHGTLKDWTWISLTKSYIPAWLFKQKGMMGKPSGVQAVLCPVTRRNSFSSTS